jgi:hypothetical protein
VPQRVGLHAEQFFDFILVVSGRANPTYELELETLRRFVANRLIDVHRKPLRGEIESEFQMFPERLLASCIASVPG